MHDLNRFVIPKIEAHWEGVAYALRFGISTIDSINKKHKGDPKMCCQELLKSWLTTSHGVKNLSTLLEKSMKFHTLQMSVQAYLIICPSLVVIELCIRKLKLLYDIS